MTKYQFYAFFFSLLSMKDTPNFFLEGGANLKLIGLTLTIIILIASVVYTFLAIKEIEND